MSTTSSFNEGDRVQYKMDLEGANLSEGTIQKVIRGGESLSEVPSETASTRPSIPRYVKNDNYHYNVLFNMFVRLCVCRSLKTITSIHMRLLLKSI